MNHTEKCFFLALNFFYLYLFDSLDVGGSEQETKKIGHIAFFILQVVIVTLWKKAKRTKRSDMF